MTTTSVSAEGWPLMLRTGTLFGELNDDQFFELCQSHRNLRLERTSDGEVIVMPPTGGDIASYELRVAVAAANWAEADGTGLVFGPSAGFTLPNHAVRSPDVAWVLRTRWDALSPEQRAKFPPLCPDFVVEVRSRTDSLRDLLEKMQEYMENGARLGWLIDPLEKKVYVYEPGRQADCLDDPELLAGDPVLPGFKLDVRRLWP